MRYCPRMNLKEVVLEELELPVSVLKEGISALLHTLLFLRAPNQIKACDAFVAELGLGMYKSSITSDRCNSDITMF